MIRDEKLSLPNNWEAVLEQMMLKTPIGVNCERIYICSPCRADTPDGVIRNMKAARVYMFYAYIHFSCVPKAPHAYMPVLLNDNNEHERILALMFGKQLLENCGKLIVCGDRLSEGMYGEIKSAVKYRIPVHVFNQAVYDELRECFIRDGIDPDIAQYDIGHPHFALSWGSDELAPYWEGDGNA